jgi:secreted Zn-dependent insulinase-like peptidase
VHPGLHDLVLHAVCEMSSTSRTLICSMPCAATALTIPMLQVCSSVGPVTIAGLQYALDSTTQGLQLTGSGFSHKLPELVHTVLAKLADLPITEDRFEARVLVYPLYHLPAANC